MTSRAAILILLLVACSKSSPGGGGGGPGPSQPAYDLITGVWQGAVDAGTEAAILRLTIVEDGGTLLGFKYINDPNDANEFHMLQPFTGTRTGNSIVLQTPTETITATLDGGILVGVDPLTDPRELDAGRPPQSINLSFAMSRITRTVILPDAGDYR